MVLAKKTSVEEIDKECNARELLIDEEGITNLAKCKPRGNYPQDVTNAVNNKCSKCKTRLSRRGCTDNACLLCCRNEKCPAHAESREKAKCNDNLLNRNTEIARMAKRQRSLALLPGSFRETGFSFTEQTIKIWDIQEFMANHKWKEDAIRRCQKRKAREQKSDRPVLKINRKRFRNFIENHYRQSKNKNTI